jgi:hypothetical protein
VNHEVSQSWLTIALYRLAQIDSCHVDLHLPWIDIFVSEDCAFEHRWEVVRQFVCLEIVRLSTDEK